MISDASPIRRSTRCLFSVAVIGLLSACVVNITGPMSWDVGSDPRALTEVLTGSQVADCVPKGAKVGDIVMLEGGDMAEVKSISANQTRCLNPQRPVAANVQRKSAPAVQTKPAPPSIPSTTPASHSSPSGAVMPTGAAVKFGKLCEGLGFGSASAGFSSCVNELADREVSSQAPEASNGHITSCKNLGFTEGTLAFNSCVGELSARLR